MGLPTVPGVPSIQVTPPATAFGTVVVTCVRPTPNIKGLPLIFGPKPGSSGYPNWWSEGWYAHLTDLIVTCSTTANVITLMRPLNWTTVATAVAKNTTSMVLTDDPGVYSTNYRYPLPGQTWNPPGTTNSVGPSSPASDNAIAGNDYVAYQLADGRWVADKVSSVSGLTLTLTTGTPNVTGATVAAGSPVFFYGITTDTEPYTGAAHLFRTPIVSTQLVNLLAGWGGNASAVGGGGGAASGPGAGVEHPGDPILVYNANATATTTVDFIGGYYARYGS